MKKFGFGRFDDKKCVVSHKKLYPPNNKPQYNPHFQSQSSLVDEININHTTPIWLIGKS